MSKIEADSVIFSPQNVAVSAYQVIEDRQRNPRLGVTTGIAGVDQYLNPHRPGELRVVLGYTSNYKTGLMNYIARNAARSISADEAADNHCVITVTWEQSIEEQGITDLAQLSDVSITKMMRGELDAPSWSKLRKAAVERGGLPWWLIGHSNQAGSRRPRLSMTDLANAVAYLIDTQDVKPELIVLDYLQRIKREGDTGEARLQFMDIVDRAKDMALAYNVPVMLGSQAGRSVKTRVWQLPQVEDAQETSNLEQSADSLLSVWMPKQSYPEGQIIEYGSLKLIVNPNLLVLGIMKQKFGIAPKIMGLYVKPEINEIRDLEVKR